ncbi:MAG: zeta toxin family protein [Candidatus Pacebacteria bacterium]|jgi:UDP-N-acetylglucosamine kinase|nr:zeta toxin family protein [Candidatus Paceibacterota bacterium]
MTEEVSTLAYDWVKNNHDILIKSIAGNYNDSGVGRVSVFMAGAPGAGKTEFSRTLIKDKFGLDTNLIVRIDPDEIRLQIPMYIDGKAELFNRAVTKAVEVLVDHCYDRKFDKSFLLDGTLSNIEVARKNIDRALKRERKVLIYFVYKDPLIAWHFTKVREIAEGRNIPKESFIEQYFGSIETINALKHEYGDRVQIDLVQLSVPKPDSHQLTDYRFDFNIASIDGYIKVKYSKKQLLELL